jgi:hypothetical protein
MSVPADLMGPPPGPSLAQLPPGPPGMGAPPPPADPISQLSSAAQGLTAAGEGAMMILAQLLGQQASPEAMAAQTSPGPALPPGPGPSAGPAGF